VTQNEILIFGGEKGLTCQNQCVFCPGG
jgi:hypothetical protein